MGRRIRKEPRIRYNLKTVSARTFRRMKLKKKLLAAKTVESSASSASTCSSSEDESLSSKVSDFSEGDDFNEVDDADLSKNYNSYLSDDGNVRNEIRHDYPALDISRNETSGSMTDGSDFTSQTSDVTSVASTTVDTTFTSDLKALVNNYPQIPGQAITGFLKLLHKHKKNMAEEIIPSDYRGLMKTPRLCKVRQLEERTTYYYFGIQLTLQKYSQLLKNITTIMLGVFIDGVEGDRSTGLVHWPILGKVLEIKENVIFPIALYTGYSKPKCVESYLRQFVTEANNLYLNGILIDRVTKNFKLIRILGDAPARCLFLNTAPPNAFNHCVYCTIRGENLLNRNHFYEKVPSIERNNEDFTNYQYSDNLQKGRTPLMDLIDFSILEGCPYDPMHMIMRLVRTLLGFMVDVEPNKVRRRRSKLYRLSPTSKKMISNDLIKWKRYIPMEFQRKTDALDKFSRWKATQNRFFLLYASPVVLWKRVHKEVYRNFLLLHFSLRLLSMKNVTPAQMNRVQLHLQQFVHSYAEIYGPEAVTHYIHALLHIVPLVKIHGPLLNFAAFLFESYLGNFKHFKHSSRLPSQQIVNRIIERQLACRELYMKNKRMNKFPDNSQYNDGELPPNFLKNNFQSYSQINLETCTINACKDSDNLIFLKNGNIFRVQNIVVSRINSNDINLYGYCLTDKQNFYTYPEPSSVVGIHRATDDYDAKLFKKVFNVSEFHSKCIGLPLEKNQIVVECMLH